MQDLLRHTSGLTYGTRGTALVNQSYIDAKIGDPKEELVGIYMVQASAEDTRFLRNQFRSMVQAAIID